MSWWQGDELEQYVKDGELVVRNLKEHKIQPMHQRAEYGDAISRKP